MPIFGIELGQFSVVSYAQHHMCGCIAIGQKAFTLMKTLIRPSPAMQAQLEQSLTKRSFFSRKPKPLGRVTTNLFIDDISQKVGGQVFVNDVRKTLNTSIRRKLTEQYFYDQRAPLWAHAPALAAPAAPSAASPRFLRHLYNLFGLGPTKPKAPRAPSPAASQIGIAITRDDESVAPSFDASEAYQVAALIAAGRPPVARQMMPVEGMRFVVPARVHDLKLSALKEVVEPSEFNKQPEPVVITSHATAARLSVDVLSLSIPHLNEDWAKLTDESVQSAASSSVATPSRSRASASTVDDDATWAEQMMACLSPHLQSVSASPVVLRPKQLTHQRSYSAELFDNASRVSWATASTSGFVQVFATPPVPLKSPLRALTPADELLQLLVADWHTVVTGFVI